MENISDFFFFFCYQKRTTISLVSRSTQTHCAAAFSGSSGVCKCSNSQNIVSRQLSIDLLFHIHGQIANIPLARSLSGSFGCWWLRGELWLRIAINRLDSGGLSVGAQLMVNAELVTVIELANHTTAQMNVGRST